MEFGTLNSQPLSSSLPLSLSLSLLSLFCSLSLPNEVWVDSGWRWKREERPFELVSVLTAHPGGSTMVDDNMIGFLLASSSSAFIGSSFVVKKKGLRRAGSSGRRAGQGGYGYLREPLWWIGMISMIAGEAANFAAYAFAPPVLVTPLGALSIVFSAVLAHRYLNEKLNVFGIVGCIQCVVGSITITLHAPDERALGSVNELFLLATQPDFAAYAIAAVSIALFLIFRIEPKYGHTHIFVSIGICSLFGSLSVMSCKALGMAIKMTFEGNNQFVYGATYLCIVVVACCVVVQINYLNKALDLFNSAIVSPIYYVMFTVLTIVASMILFKEKQTWAQTATQLCGFVTIVTGTTVLHLTRDLDVDLAGTLAGTLRAKGGEEVALSMLSPRSDPKDSV